MKITVEFESLLEFQRHMHIEGALRGPVEKEAAATKVFAEARQRIQDLQKEAEAEAAEEAAAPWLATDPEPVKEEKPAPAYVLADAQKAVREVVKKKGKDIAKEILARFQHKDKEGEPATGASALRPEDYADAIKALEDALNA